MVRPLLTAVRASRHDDCFVGGRGIIDVRDVLPLVRVPTLILSHKDSPLIPVGQGRYLADNIPGRAMSSSRALTSGCSPIPG